MKKKIPVGETHETHEAHAAHEADPIALAQVAATIAAGLVSRGDDLQTAQGYGAIAEASVAIARRIQDLVGRRD